jgi:phospholipid/cholesterol/gamma-HCH transport system substrate-binding protein
VGAIGENVPSQKQLRWAQLRVGLTVIFAAVVMGVLIFLMSGTTSLFSPSFRLVCYVDNANGLRNGAPVRLSSVDVGNVEKIRIVNHHDQYGNSTPVEIVMKINGHFQPFIHTDSKVLVSTAGVLGEAFVDIDSNHASGPVVANNAELYSQQVPDFQEVVRASQSTLQNVSVLVTRLDRIVSAVEDRRGSVGQLIYDKQLYTNLNSSVAEVNRLLRDVDAGRGSLGKLLNDDTLYTRASDTINKLNTTADALNSDQGSVGKFIHDPELYNNANQTLAKANRMMDSIDRGEGAFGKFAKDPEFARKVDVMITNLSKISEELQAGQGTAGKFLKDPALYDNSNKLVVSSQELITAFRQDPKRYLSIKVHIF